MNRFVEFEPHAQLTELLAQKEEVLSVFAIADKYLLVSKRGSTSVYSAREDSNML